VGSPCYTPRTAMAGEAVGATVENTLYFGDNLSVLTGRDGQGQPYFPDACVDLVYLDPPFNSNRSYNVLFKDEHGAQAPSQITAFEDTWNWASAADTYEATLADADTPDRVRRALEALHDLLGASEMMAYLAMMTPRLLQLHRVLKPTGSLYLHCDQTASHYLKIVLDTVFGPENFKNEIIWQRTNAHNDSKRYGNNADTILFYAKTKEYLWHPQYIAYSAQHIAKKFTDVDSNGRRYAKADLTAAKPGGDVSYEWNGVKPYGGRYWAYSRSNMEKFEAEGRLVYGANGMPRLKRYLDELPGVPLQTVWTDIDPINSQAGERLGYATQKPTALLKRIIEASSNTGDVVLDPFCGCGTAIDAAQELGRTWIGIDVTHLAINLIKSRLAGRYGLKPGADYRVVGEPRDIGSARSLALADREGFEYWALSLVHARPLEGKQKKGADHGRDGLIIFFDDESRKPRRAIVSVKSGTHVGVADIRELDSVVTREKAQLGVFVTLTEPTKPMRDWAIEAGMYTPEQGITKGMGLARAVRRIQILTIAELLAGKMLDLPQGHDIATLKRAQRAESKEYAQPALIGGAEPDS
jgi:site-specific DNA-methyltransferase (adenine-specific)